MADERNQDRDSSKPALERREDEKLSSGNDSYGGGDAGGSGAGGPTTGDVSDMGEQSSVDERNQGDVVGGRTGGTTGGPAGTSGEDAGGNISGGAGEHRSDIEGSGRDTEFDARSGTIDRETRGDDDAPTEAGDGAIGYGDTRTI